MPFPLFHPESETLQPTKLTGSEFGDAFVGEGETVEFKTGISGPKIRQAVVAFSNTKGGVLLVGVDDSGAVVGVADPGQAERKLRDSLDGLHNPGRFGVTTVEVDDRSILVLAVARRREGFSQTSDGAVHVRKGARNETLFGLELNRFQRERAFENFEDAPSPSPFADADPELISRAAHAYGLDPDDIKRPFLERGLVTAVDGRLVLTVAGALILLADPGAEIGRCGIDVRRYRKGETESDKRTLIDGPIDQVVRSATAAVMDELGKQSVLVGIKRVDLPRLPEVAVRETIANAVAHRSYEANGTHTRIEIRSDAVTVISPGSLPEPVTVEHIRTQQAARNPKLLDFLLRLGLAEDQGLGIDRIEDAIELDMLEPAHFAADAHSVTVTLSTTALVSPGERGWVRLMLHDHVINADQARVALHAARDGSVTNSMVRTILGIDSTEARVLLQQLCDEGVLLRQGSGGGARYLPAADLGTRRGVTASTEHADEVMSLAQEREISNADVRKLLGVSRQRSLDMLNWLVERGSLERSGAGRGATYRPVQR